MMLAQYPHVILPNVAKVIICADGEKDLKSARDQAEKHVNIH